ncbi:MBOAT family protein, putative [Talaromyces stipitatus ATCC 10500]|uniref:MBOAT family protein, putative n=1 Tax=Talaromyces stipitatus (strain ATCC 10500 / CBS 375.48 / QM 6759 / NRRL 1006) TaxID=441959 RepID=B8MTV2_TALSN|nr:MBOAT family protein, putative [Talaromyces stipitatus ATCC 10500]EED12495.1 MBOAT family protein, putative [Talaromyces stipitatus ATCC 10500]
MAALRAFIDAPFASAANVLGASLDEVKLIGSFLLSYPLAAILKRIPDKDPWKKDLFIIVVSLFYILGLYELWDGLLTLLYSSVATYLIAYYIDGSLMPWIGFIFLMGHMSISHIYRQIANDASVVDITGPQMVLVMKLSAFCWNVHDGRLPDKDLTDAQKYAAIREFPSILDYAGYVLFFPSLFAGPAFDYVDYRRWIDTTLFEVPPDTDPSKVPPTRKKRKIPRSGRPAFKKMVMGILWILAFVQLAPYYPFSLYLGDEFKAYSLPRRIWQLYMLGLVTRLKYYGCWALTEGACILSGLGYNGFDPKTGKVFWDRLENVNPWGLETAQNTRGYLENWNKNTNHWLRNYVYLRVTPKGKKPGFRASLATFSTSAFWHGFYPGYYLAFVLASFVQTVAKNFRRYVRPFFLSPDGSKPTAAKPYYDVASWVITQLIMSFTVAPFVLLSFSGTIAVWGHVYFYGIVGVASAMVFFSSPAKGYLIAQQKKRSRPGIARKVSVEAPVLGLPSDLEQEVEDAIKEISAEIEEMRKNGAITSMPTPQELRALVEEKLKRK